MVTSERQRFLDPAGIFTNWFSIRAWATLFKRSSLVSADFSFTLRVFAADCSCDREMSAVRSSLKVDKTMTLAEARSRPKGKG